MKRSRYSDVVRQYLEDERDRRGESFESSDEDLDPMSTISSPSGTARALSRTHGRSAGAWGREARGRYRGQARKYAQHATMMLSNPTLPASERAALLQSLRQSGAPAYGGDAVQRAAAFGPGALPGHVGLVGSRRGMGEYEDSIHEARRLMQNFTIEELQVRAQRLARGIAGSINDHKSSGDPLRRVRVADMLKRQVVVASVAVDLARAIQPTPGPVLTQLIRAIANARAYISSIGTQKEVTAAKIRDLEQLRIQAKIISSQIRQYINNSESTTRSDTKLILRKGITSRILFGEEVLEKVKAIQPMAGPVFIALAQAVADAKNYIASTELARGVAAKTGATQKAPAVALQQKIQRELNIQAVPHPHTKEVVRTGIATEVEEDIQIAAEEMGTFAKIKQWAWPAEAPIYKRPLAIGVTVLVVAGIMKG